VLRNYLTMTMLVLGRRRFFTFVNLFGITFTLAVLLVATAILDHIFGGSPPEVHQGRTLAVLRASLLSDEDSELYASALPSHMLLDRHLRDLPGAENVSISSVFWKAVSYVRGQRIDSFLKYTDAEFWEILRFDFIEGRPFTHDEVDGASPVAVINAASRERFFAGQPAFGKRIEVDGRRYRVVGVVEDVPMLRLVPFADIWVPLTTATSQRTDQGLIGMHMGLILASGRDQFDQIRDEFASRMASEDLSMHPGFNRLVAVPETTFESLSRLVFSLGKSEQTESARLVRWLVLLAVLFMVLPSINLVNLNVSRIMERASEIGVRKAFGAPSLTLMGQFIVENVVLTLVGGVMALGVTYLLLALISGAGWIPYAQFHLNLRIFAYAVAMALFFGLFSGVYPAWKMARLHPVEALRGARS
jgi:putative ABC transport system permease protein